MHDDSDLADEHVVFNVLGNGSNLSIIFSRFFSSRRFSVFVSFFLSVFFFFFNFLNGRRAYGVGARIRRISIQIAVKV